MKHISEISKWAKIGLVVPGLALIAAGCNNNESVPESNVSEVTEAATEVVTPLEGEGVGADVSDPNKDVRAFVRVVHLVPEAGAVTLQSDGQPILEGATFGQVSDYVGLGGEKTDIQSTQDHRFTIVGADGQVLGDPVPFDLDKGEDVTLMVSGTPTALSVTPLRHTARPMSNISRLALVYSPELGPRDGQGPTLRAMLDEKPLTVPTNPAASLDYQTVEPGSHTIKVMSEGAPELSKTQVMQAGRTYTALVYKGASGTAEMKILEDKYRPALIRADTATTENPPSENMPGAE